MKENQEIKDKDKKVEEEKKEERVKLDNIEDTISYYEELIAKALASGNDRGAFRLYQGACSTGLSAIKYVIRNPNDGHSKRFEFLTKEVKKGYGEFITDTESSLDALDFDDKEVKDNSDKMIEHFVKDLHQTLNDSFEAVQRIFYSNWIDNISSIWSDIKEKLIALKIVNLTKIRSRSEIRREYRAKRLMERLVING